ncbi:MAG: HD domain-containing protein, partial [Candidatus Zixiibacteriota bacterium]
VLDILMESLGEFEDFLVNKFTNAGKAIEYIGENVVDLVLTDLVMGKYSGVQILETTLKNHPEAIVILMTGYPTVKTAISVLKKGGYDYLIKPFKLEDLKSTIRRGLEHQRIRRENLELRSQLELMKISEALAGGGKLYPLLTRIVESAVREIEAEAASLVVLDRKAEKYRLRCLSGSEPGKSVEEFLRAEGLKGALSLDRDKAHTIKEEIKIEGKPYKRSYVIYPLISKGQNIGFLNLVSTNRFSYISPGQEHLVSLLASMAASAVESTYMDKNLRKSYLLTIKALANAVEARDVYTAGHTNRVYRLAKSTARKMGWENDQMMELRNGCILHDIGKIGVPDAILNKPGKLTERERKIMQEHPETGARILHRIPFLKPVTPYVLSHHERYDGTGYPHGLAGENIPIEGRLLAVVDTFDAIMTDRPYRPSADAQKALEELIRFKCKQFDPAVVDAFMEAYHEGSLNCRAIYGRSSLKGETKPVQTAPV